MIRVHILWLLLLLSQHFVIVSTADVNKFIYVDVNGNLVNTAGYYDTWTGTGSAVNFNWRANTYQSGGTYLRGFIPLQTSTSPFPAGQCPVDATCLTTNGNDLYAVYTGFCPQGRYFSGFDKSYNALTCSLCATGTYTSADINNRISQTSCTNCPVKTTSNEGASSCSVCPTGSYCPGGVAAISCGYQYVSAAGASSFNECTPCVYPNFPNSNGDACTTTEITGWYNIPLCAAGDGLKARIYTYGVWAKGYQTGTVVGDFTNPRLWYEKWFDPTQSYGVSYLGYCWFFDTNQDWWFSMKTTSPVTPVAGNFNLYQAAPFPGSAGNIQNARCEQCPEGTYSNLFYSDPIKYTVRLCLDCSINYTSPAGSTSSTACTRCTYGGYPSQIGGSRFCLCQAGYWNSAIQTVCTICTAGSYAATSGSSNCTASPVGYYCDMTGMTVAKLCPAGSYCPSAGMSVATICPAGSYCPVGASAATICPAGKYSSSGKSQCTPCMMAGSYCPSGATALGTCPAGNYCPNVSTIIACTTSGLYCPAGITAIGQQCPAGSYCKDTASIATCISGNYCPTGSTVNNTCLAGYYCSSPSSTQNQCATAGQYCPAGTTSPLSCPAGYYCWPTSSSTVCPLGQYCPGGVTSGISCPIGSYCPNTGMSIPTVCPANSNSTSGATFCTCNPGYTGPNNGPCTACAIGFYKTVSGTSSCTACSGIDLMMTTNGTGSNMVTNCQCDKGYTGSNGVGPCTPCVSGTYKDVIGSSVCTNCVLKTNMIMDPGISGQMTPDCPLVCIDAFFFKIYIGNLISNYVLMCVNQNQRIWPANYYSNDNGAGIYFLPCPNNTFIPSGSWSIPFTSCFPCPSNVTSGCGTCPLGQYIDTTNKICKVCPYGSNSSMGLICDTTYPTTPAPTTSTTSAAPGATTSSTTPTSGATTSSTTTPALTSSSSSTTTPALTSSSSTTTPAPTSSSSTTTPALTSSSSSSTTPAPTSSSSNTTPAPTSSSSSSTTPASTSSSSTTTPAPTSSSSTTAPAPTSSSSTTTPAPTPAQTSTSTPRPTTTPSTGIALSLGLTVNITDPNNTTQLIQTLSAFFRVPASSIRIRLTPKRRLLTLQNVEVTIIYPDVVSAQQGQTSIINQFDQFNVLLTQNGLQPATLSTPPIVTDNGTIVTAPNNNNSTNQSTGMIIGIVLGIVAFLILVSLGVWWWWISVDAIPPISMPTPTAPPPPVIQPPADTIMIPTDWAAVAAQRA